jgi:hypothetical protein
MSDPGPSQAVAEIQGLYGPFTFSEKLLQKIWASGSFDQSALRTESGIRLKLMNPGKWNLLAGPDFKHARWQLGDAPEMSGDVELHLRAEDWDAHGHVSDPAYDGVKLHVVLFPPKPGLITRGRQGQAIPILALLPRLQHDLEEYAADEAVAQLSNHSEIRLIEQIQQIDPLALREQMMTAAVRRWQQKKHFAGIRIVKVGWEGACHETALEILGYRYNRVPMLALAARHPLAEWPALVPDLLQREEVGRWARSGVRPANLPGRRLQQYVDWVSKVPDWPQRLWAIAIKLPRPDPEQVTSHVRRSQGMSKWREEFGSQICGHALGGTRLDTLICDGFLPLLAAKGAPDLMGFWYHWYLGDAPQGLNLVLRQTQTSRAGRVTFCHGIVQGLIGWLLAREAAGRSVGS